MLFLYSFLHCCLERYIIIKNMIRRAYRILMVACI